MLSIIGLIIFIWTPALVVIIRNIAHHTYIWQIKEYRVDRILSQMRFAEERSLKSNWLNFAQIILLIGTIVFFINPNNWLLLIPALTLLSYTYEAFTCFEQITLKRFVRPKKSIRNLLIFGFSFLTLLLPMLLPINFTRNIYKNPEFEKKSIAVEIQRVEFKDFLVQKRIGESDANGISLALAVTMISSALILASDLASSFVTSFFAITTEPLAQYKRKKMINRAKKEVTSHKGFKVVAITGSYGKTTTKELLYYLIKDNFKTAITEKNYNSTVGIAQSVLQSLESDTEVFVAEMGAYRKGEIHNSTNILQPDISIVTGLNNQHVSLFGNLKKLFQAKYEIIEALKPEGLAIFNANNNLSLQMATKTKQRKITYDVAHGEEEKNEYLKKEKPKGEIYAKNLQKTENGFKFDLNFKTASYPITIKLQGRHNVENLLAAIATALELGMSLKDIAAKINTTEPPQMYLRTFNGYNEATIIDDSYNSNAIGFKKALNELKNSQGQRKIVISKGIIELGKERNKTYTEIAASFIGIDILYTTDKHLAKKVKLVKVRTILARDNFELISKVLHEVRENDVVLLEGALPDKLINTLIEPNN